MPDDRPAEPKSFWATLPGILTAFAGVCAAITALITALVSAGLIGGSRSAPTSTPTPVAAPTPATAPLQAPPTPAPITSPAPRAVPDEPSRAELEETKRRLDEATRARQQADVARARADAEAARLRQAQATAAAEAKRMAELEAVRKKAEDAEAARVSAEAELARLRREAAARSPAPSGGRPSTDPVPSAPSYENAPTRDAVTSFRVISTSGEEMDIEIAFSFDPRVHGDRVLAGVHLRYQGTIITGYKPTTASWQRGKSVVRIVVRTARGRQSDELEVFLYKSGEKPFLSRRFPFAFTLG